jgi:hypothetical protein
MRQVMPHPAFLQQEQTAQEQAAQKVASLLPQLLRHHPAAAASPRCLQLLQLPLQPQLAVAAAAVMRC